MIAAIIVGVMGFGFHLSGDLAGTGKISLERMLIFAPILVPLLYGDLGINCCCTTKTVGKKMIISFIIKPCYNN
jgi:hypothetical protein